jgi:hypothetical protein
MLEGTYDILVIARRAAWLISYTSMLDSPELPVQDGSAWGFLYSRTFLDQTLLLKEDYAHVIATEYCPLHLNRRTGDLEVRHP